MQNFIEENNWYIEQLFAEKNIQARDYLYMRNIKQGTALYWKLGFSPLDDINPTLKGLDIYKKMQGRITIPIYNQNNKLISISGRYIYNDGKKPKYDHYPFPSRATLFGLAQNKDEIKKTGICYITEGQMDVIKAWQSGIKNVVCSFGAHCSLNHIALASRYCNKIIILYDNDFAGQNGAKQVYEYKKYGIDISVYNILPSGQDLDNYFNTHTAEQFNTLVSSHNKVDILQYKLSCLKEKKS